MPIRETFIECINKRQTPWKYYIKEGDVKYKKVEDDTRQADFDLLLTSPGGYVGNAIFKKISENTYAYFSDGSEDEESDCRDHTGSETSTDEDKKAYYVHPGLPSRQSRAPRYHHFSLWKQQVVNNNGKGHLDTSRTEISGDSQDYMILMQEERKKKREKLEAILEQEEEIIPPVLFKQGENQENTPENSKEEGGELTKNQAEMQINTLPEKTLQNTATNLQSLGDPSESKEVQLLTQKLILAMAFKGIDTKIFHTADSKAGLLFTITLDCLEEWIKTQLNKDHIPEEEDEERQRKIELVREWLKKLEKESKTQMPEEEESQQEENKPETINPEEITQTTRSTASEIPKKKNEFYIQPLAKYNVFRPYSNEDIRHSLQTFRAEQPPQEDEPLQMIWASLLQKHIKAEISEFMQENGNTSLDNKEKWRKIIIKLGFGGGSDYRDQQICTQIIMNSLEEMGIMLDTEQMDTRFCVKSPNNFFNPHVFHFLWAQVK